MTSKNTSTSSSSTCVPSRSGWATALIAVGLVWATIGGLVALPFFGRSAFGVLPLISGGALLVVGAALLPSSSNIAAWGDRVRRASGLAVAGLVLVGGLGASWALRQAAVRVDVTRAQVNTLAEESVAIATRLEGPTRVVAFVDDDDSRQALRVLVGRYQAHAPTLTFELRSVRIAADLDVAGALGVAELLPLGGPNVVVVSEGHAPVRLRLDGNTSDAEAQLTNALRRASSDLRRKVYVLAGHGEPAINDDGANGLSRLAGQLRARDVDLVPLPLNRLRQLPDDAAAIVLLPGVTPLDDGEMARLRAALAAKDRPALLLAFEPSVADDVTPSVTEVAGPEPFFVGLAASVGIDVFDDVIVDESPFSSLLGGADLATGQGVLGHPLTRPLRGALTHFPRALLLAESPVAGWTTSILISTGAEAHARRTGAVGSLPLVIAASPADSTADAHGRTLVVADASFLQNAGISLGANLDLATNAILWLTAADDDLTIRPKRKSGSLIFLTPSGREGLAFAVLVGVPGLLLGLAAAWAARRRTR